MVLVGLEQTKKPGAGSVSATCLGMSTSGRTFHLFSRLAAELRDAIWRECLPDRVCELDDPIAGLVYNKGSAAPCQMRHTSFLNERPPVITRVCRESRAVAFQAGKEAASKNHARASHEHVPISFGASTQRLSITNNWTDRVPSRVHMYWTARYAPEYDLALRSSADPISIHCLATSASHWSAGRASIMVERLSESFSWDGHWDPFWDDFADSDDDFDAPPPVRKPFSTQQGFISAFKQLSSCLVVLQVVVIHTDLRTAARTGLFGPLGDAPIQIIDMAEEAKIDEYFRFAVECEDSSPVSISQDLERRSLPVARRRLRDKIVWDYGSEELVTIMQPAVMFRLCALMCNHPGLPREPPLPHRLRQADA